MVQTKSKVHEKQEGWGIHNRKNVKFVLKLFISIEYENHIHSYDLHGCEVTTVGRVIDGVPQTKKQ